MAVGTLSKGIDFLEERVELGVGSCVVYVHYGINIINDIIMHTDLRHL